MIEIQRREFELQIEAGINIIVCYIPFDKLSKECLEKLDEFSKKTPEILYRKYDVSFDCDISETYEVSAAPYILVFKENHLVNKFPYTDMEKFIKKIDLNTLIKERKP